MDLDYQQLSSALRAASADQRRAGVAFIDGCFVPITDAKLSVLDWGLLHSDATYDVVHVWKGCFFRLDDHLERFAHSLKHLRLSPGLTRNEIAAILESCVALSGLREAYVEMACTRGIPQSGSRDPRSCTNRFFAFAVPFVWLARLDREPEGLRAWVGTPARIPPESVDPQVKNYHWLDFTLGLFNAYDHGAETVILPDLNGYLSEGPGFNVFVVHAGHIATPDQGILQGITRQTVFELAGELGYPIASRPVTISEAHTADEIFVSSTAGGVIPVGQLDGQRIGAGAAGPVTQKLQHRYWEKKEAGWHSRPVDYGMTFSRSE
jgi:branched-chain amino acid aminotransferase